MKWPATTWAVAGRQHLAVSSRRPGRLALYDWSPTTACVLLAAYSSPPAPAAYDWPPPIGRMLPAACCWPPAPIRLPMAAYYWPPAFGCPLLAYSCPPPLTPPPNKQNYSTVHRRL